jgi:hypothetical protein
MAHTRGWKYLKKGKIKPVIEQDCVWDIMKRKS